MRRASVVVLSTLIFFLFVAVAGASLRGPEVDQAQATFKVSTTKTPVSKTCAGEDGATYETDTATLHGTETETGTVTGDTPLTGKLTITATITTQMTAISNGSLGTGYATGLATLERKRVGGLLFKGRFTALTQVTNPDPENTVVEGRGLIDAPLYDPETNKVTGNHLVANFEFMLTSTVSGTTTTTAIEGEFGVGPSQYASLNYSVETNERVCS